MKKITTRLIIAAAICLISFKSFAQDGQPRWVSDKGYWVVEANVHQPGEQVIRFYNQENEMIYKETVSGVRINLNKTKVKMKLKKALETVLVAWEKNKTAEENKDYVSAILK